MSHVLQHQEGLQLILLTFSAGNQFNCIRRSHHHPRILAKSFFAAVLLPVDDVSAIEVGTCAGVVPPPPSRYPLELQLSAVLEIVVVVSVFGGESLVVVQVVLGVHGQSVHSRPLEQPQPQPVRRRLVLHQEWIILSQLGGSVLVHQFDSQFIAPGTTCELVKVLVPKPVIASHLPEAVPVLDPGAVEIHAAVDGDMLEHSPASFLHGTVGHDGGMAWLDQVHAVSGLA